MAMCPPSERSCGSFWTRGRRGWSLGFDWSGSRISGGVWPAEATIELQRVREDSASSFAAPQSFNLRSLTDTNSEESSQSDGVRVPGRDWAVNQARQVAGSFLALCRPPGAGSDVVYQRHFWWHESAEVRTDGFRHVQHNIHAVAAAVCSTGRVPSATVDITASDKDQSDPASMPSSMVMGLTDRRMWCKHSRLHGLWHEKRRRRCPRALVTNVQCPPS
jgi:hypothetical protein